MIRPDQAGKTVASSDQAAIERYFDKHLARGVFTIGRTRSGWNASDIAAVLDKYRAEGWKVQDTGMEYIFTKQDDSH